MPRIAVIGLGRYGMELAKRLAEGGADVIAIDSNGRLVEQIQDRVALAVRLDSTDSEALAAQRLGDVDVAVVAIGEGFEATLLTVLALKQLGARHVIARARNVTRGSILEKIGADQVVLPELENARRLARGLVSPQIEDHIELGEGYSLIQLRAPKRWCGKTLMDLALRQQYGVNVVAIKRPAAGPGRDADERVVSVPRPDDLIQPDDVLVVIGADDAIAGLPAE